MALRRLVKPDDGFRVEPIGINANGDTFARIRRDFVPPVPVGSYIVMAFRITGYDPDCDGSAMARLEQVGFDGKPTGWEPDCIGLYEEVDLVVDDPADLLALVNEG